MITLLQAIILGLVQGVTELFPVSSLGHAVIIANLFNWNNLLKQETADKSGFLTFLVVLHVATAIALIIFYRREWVRIVRGLIRSIQARDLGLDSDARLGWLLIAATIPAGIIGLLFEHLLRAEFAKPIFAIIFITINGILLIKGDKVVKAAQRQRPRQRGRAAESEGPSMAQTATMVSDHLTIGRAMIIGVAQIGALFAGISRSGITMLAGLRSGLNHEDAARFSFLLATPIILAAGLYKLPDVVGPSGNGIRGQALIGGLVAGIAAYFSVKYLDKYFQTRSLRPFGIYCVILGVCMFLLGIFRGHF
ncbi:MAG TPA: undecaprenyl-diphosphate phosphatase [Candidatus Saccharimonadales bacterium]|nr:undecaprenyl-diphosphate phosphatase [Candidatus Saccharimonadales bacterium]